MKKSLKMVMVLALLALTACGTKFPPPDREITMATSAITQADSAGAYESAPVELKSARDKLGQAKQAMHNEDNLTAKRLAEQALVDANLALAKSRKAKSQKAVDELKSSIQALQEEIDRSAR